MGTSSPLLCICVYPHLFYPVHAAALTALSLFTFKACYRSLYQAIIWQSHLLLCPHKEVTPRCSVFCSKTIFTPIRAVSLVADRDQLSTTQLGHHRHHQS
ncbi:hypothetical protein VFPPC_16053 [Pochonia chlamydosporia 170]|uniref:Uncharacterized protein n=1 Tax=Pochonia chlamydosporia 170 TaxID=1380566 RepID=A0A179FN19_METCM|nr:hypothetical protein VFPPC_16053 [Pochonia chlamydosporia 170]OAQ66640.2 hypothetical protein VFPPC_16053 [Pochonia chlamydosporia 170]